MARRLDRGTTALAAIAVLLCAQLCQAAVERREPTVVTTRIRDDVEDYCLSLVGQYGTIAVVPATDVECQPPNVVWAYATYKRTFATTGWDRLLINGSTSPSVADNDRAWAVGYIEGILTADLSADMFYNQLSHNGSMPADNKTLAFIEENFEWMGTFFAPKPSAEPTTTGSDKKQFVDNDEQAYYDNMHALFLQLEGLAQGIVALTDLTRAQALALSFAGDTFDIKNIVNPPETLPQDLPKDEFVDWFVKNTHCSALFKLAPDMSDVWFGHTTWANYNMMRRLIKTVTMNLQTTSGVNAESITYSSWPGDIASTDDFYITSSGFGVVETSLSVFNMSIYEGTTGATGYFMSSVRVMLANRMATSGPHWVKLFEQYNSGTYNNEWLVLDMNKFSSASSTLQLQNNTLVLADQFPGRVWSKDVTELLAYGYVPSYNVPFFREAFDYAGYPSAVAQQGPHMLDYENCVRAQLFREQHHLVSSADTMQFVMQYNDYVNNPLELGDSIYAIAARGDHRPSPQLFGGLDTKFSSFKTVTDSNAFHAFCGPTPQQGVFAWDEVPEVSARTNKRGLPDLYNFSLTTQALP